MSGSKIRGLDLFETRCNSCGKVLVRPTRMDTKCFDCQRKTHLEYEQRRRERVRTSFRKGRIKTPEKFREALKVKYGGENYGKK